MFRHTQQAYLLVPCSSATEINPAVMHSRRKSHTIWFIWYVIHSSQFWTLSTREIMAASLFRMTACEWRGLPKTLRCVTHFKHSSTTARCVRATEQTKTQRSWLKLESITKIPLPSGPSVFPTGTLTLSKVMKAVPAVGDYDMFNQIPWLRKELNSRKRSW